MARIPQHSFSRGEVDPELHGRRDVDSFRTFLKTARNGIISNKGGIYNRPGTPFLAPIKDHTKKARLVEFEFGTTDTHLLEFGDLYIRFMRNDAHIIETAVVITGATAADPVVITTSGAHGYANGEEIYHAGIVGMTELNERRFNITVLSGTTYSLQDQVTGTDIDGTGYTAYTSDGEASRIYEISTPYTEADLPYLKFEQSFDFLTIVRQGKPTRELKRIALDDWTLDELVVTPTQVAPSSVSIAVNTTDSDTARYAVTSVSADTNEESLAALSATTATITGITKADPAVITVSGAQTYQTGHEMEINGVVGMTELNGRRIKLTFLTTTTFEAQGIDSTLFTTYTSGGTMAPAFAEVTNSLSGTSTDNNVNFGAVSGALRYNIYKEENGVFGFLGDTENTTYLDDGTLSPDLQDTAPFFLDPFFGAGNEPGAVGNHQQRQVFGGTTNAPDKHTYSRVGAFHNFNRSVPLRVDDSFSAFLNGSEVNDIRHFKSARDLLVFTNSSIWPISSGSDIFWLSTIKQSGKLKIGCSHRPPIEVGKKILFEEEFGQSVRALEFEFSTDGYEPEDVSLFSSHLLKNDTITYWAYLEWPEPIILMTMESGNILCLTYNPEEQSQVKGWSKWDTKGDFESVAAIRAISTDKYKSGYFIVKREVDGQTTRYIEKLNSREFDVVEDAFFVDCGTTYDNPISIESITSANPLVMGITAHPFSDGDVIDLSEIQWTPEIDKWFNETNPDYLNGRRYKVSSSTANTFQLTKIDGDLSVVDGSAFPAYVSGGVARLTVTELSSFRYLAGETLVGLLDGNVVRDLVVSSEGVITLPVATARAHIGIGYISDIETLTPVSKSANFAIDGEIVTATQVVLDFYKSRGVLIGPTIDKLREWKQREFERHGQPTNLFTGKEDFVIDVNMSLDPSIFVRQKDPLPITIRGIIPDYV